MSSPTPHELALSVAGTVMVKQDAEIERLKADIAPLLASVTALEAENARMRDALESIQKHCEPHQSVLAIAVVATCRNGLGAHLSAGST